MSTIKNYPRSPRATFGDLVSGIKAVYRKDDTETIERVQKSLDSHSWVSKAYGRNDFGVEHTEIDTGQQNMTLMESVAADSTQNEALNW